MVFGIVRHLQVKSPAPGETDLYTLGKKEKKRKKIRAVFI